MKHFLMFYEVADDCLARRGQFRDAHLKKAWESHGRGELVLGGALADPVDSAVLLFAAESRSVPEAFAKADPYVLNGIVTGWKVREWTTVVGRDAEVKLPPGV